jgi:hypothetical protein
LEIGKILFVNYLSLYLYSACRDSQEMPIQSWACGIEVAAADAGWCTAGASMMQYNPFLSAKVLYTGS